MQTAQEFIHQYQDKFRENDGGVVTQLMINFAKFHVIEAQTAWFNKIKSESLITEAGIAYLENAYPLDKIK